MGGRALEKLTSAIKGSPALREGNNAIFVVWDENDYGPPRNQVVTIVDSNFGVQGTQSNTSYSHFSLLKTLEAGTNQASQAASAAGAGTVGGALCACLSDAPRGHRHVLRTHHHGQRAHRRASARNRANGGSHPIHRTHPTHPTHPKH
jgi:hypothetical protein